MDLFYQGRVSLARHNMFIILYQRRPFSSADINYPSECNFLGHSGQDNIAYIYGKMCVESLRNLRYLSSRWAIQQPLLG